MHQYGLVIVMFFTEGDVKLFKKRAGHALTDPSEDGLSR